MNEIQLQLEYNQLSFTDDFAKAVRLNAEVKISAQMAEKALFDLFTKLREMNESGYYTLLGYKNFREYVKEEAGVEDRQAYKYISIVENLPESYVPPGADLKISNLYALSTLTEEERTDLAEDVDLENITKRELEKKVKEIKMLRIDLEKTTEENESLNERLIGLESENEQKVKDNEQLKTELDSTTRTNAELTRRLDEFERRPVEVMIQNNKEEVDEIRQAMEKEKKDIHEHYKAQIEELTVEYEAKLSEAERAVITEAVADVKETFKMYYAAAYNSFGSLLKFVVAQGDSHKEVFIEKIIKLADSLKESAKNYE